MKRISLIGLLGIFGTLALQAAPSPWGLIQETADTLFGAGSAKAITTYRKCHPARTNTVCFPLSKSERV